MKSAEWLRESVGEEFATVELGDKRRNRRLQKVVSTLEKEPGKSFPQIFGTSELEGFYRLLRNEAVTWNAVLEPHIAASCARASEIGECLVIHDTTEFQFSGRDALGATSSNAKGFLGHFSLLVAMDAHRTPLGVGSLLQYQREDRHGRRLTRDRLDDESSEGRRWLQALEAVEVRAAGKFSCIHVTDREGDIFALFSGALELGARFVVRAAQDRRILDDDGEVSRLHEQLLQLRPSLVRKITVSARGKGLNPTMERTHPPRTAREARVAMAGTTVWVANPLAHRTRETLELNVVRVWEQKPRAGQPAVEWILWTTEPVDTPEQIERIVDIYRARWVIEEYFKALKSGCGVERRQLEFFETLTNAVAIFAPIAWRLLLARSVARAMPKAPATAILSTTQLRILELKLKLNQPICDAFDAFRAIARLGGHLSQNGEPGWQTLARGFEELLLGQHYFLLGKEAARSDQS